MVNLNDIVPIKDRVFVTDLDNGEKITRGGIIIKDDDMTERGMRDRWARVFKVGPDVTDLAPGQWILVKHGRWTQGIKVESETGDTKLWLVEYPESVIAVADEDPRNTTVVGRSQN